MQSQIINQRAGVNRAFLKRQRLPALGKPVAKSSEPATIVPKPPKSFYELAYYWLMSRR